MKPNVEVRVVKSCDLGKVTDEAMAKFLSKAALLFHGKAVSRNPHDTGRLRSSIQFKVDGSKSATVGTNVEYAPILERGIGRYGSTLHYRAGNPSFAGQVTEGWFSNAVNDGLPEYQDLIDGMSTDIKAGWEGAS